jgi:YHS domain-containing protein
MLQHWRVDTGLILSVGPSVGEDAMENFSRRAFIGAFAAVMAAAPRAVPAAEPAREKAERVALKGYDPVSYFTNGHPEKGSREFTASYDDATYWFKNAEHRAQFVADPERYAPQFDGFCAITVSRGGKYEPDPEAWSIAGGKLYVFGSKDGVPLFRQQRTKIIAQANANWPALRTEP